MMEEKLTMEKAELSYEKQALKEGWGKRELQRQYGSSLYERLLIGKDKDKILASSQKGQIIEKPGDIVKDPYVLEFLGLNEKADYSESELENPTIGVLMCLDKNDAMVELTLPEDSNIYASKYQLYLPDKKLLQDKLKEWMEEETGGEC